MGRLVRTAGAYRDVLSAGATLSTLVGALPGLDPSDFMAELQEEPEITQFSPSWCTLGHPGPVSSSGT